MTLYLPGTRFLFDTSAIARIHQPEVLDTLVVAIDDGVAATCITVDLELGFSARSAEDLGKARIAQRKNYQVLPINENIADRAREVQLLMARRGMHRAAGAMDLLTAAIAEHHRAIVLHYDADFDHIASVTGQRTQWIVPRGSID